MVDVTGCVWTESMHIRIRIRILLSVAFSLASLICSSSANTPSASDRYIFVQSRRTWHDANSLCQTTYNSTLATIITDGDLLAAKQAAADHVHNKVWIGLTDHDLYSSESQWIWIDHTPCDYAVNNDCMNDRHWAASDPNDQGELGEDCGVLSMDTLSFYDWYCSDLFMFLCNNPLRTRSSIDSPDDTDTDDQQSPTGAAFHVLGEHGQYVVFNESFATASWSEANQLCQSTLQSSLATIGTDDQFEAVIQAFDYTQNSSTALWIGLYSNHTTQQYQWRTNLTTLCDHNDTHWMDGQPDTAGSQFNCGELVRYQNSDGVHYGYAMTQCTNRERHAVVCNAKHMLDMLPTQMPTAYNSSESEKRRKRMKIDTAAAMTLGITVFLALFVVTTVVVWHCHGLRKKREGTATVKQDSKNSTVNSSRSSQELHLQLTLKQTAVTAKDLSKGSSSSRSKVNKRRRFMKVRNALVAIIGIGSYERSHELIDEQEIDVENGDFKDLPVAKDVMNLKELFHDTLHYKIIPHCIVQPQPESAQTQTQMDGDLTGSDRKTQTSENGDGDEDGVAECETYKWTEEKLIHFLRFEVGQEMFDQSGELKHDALIVCITCHGIENHLITSDWKAVQKSAVHRIVSLTHPSLRNIPRIFLFDTCDGTAERVHVKLDLLDREPHTADTLNPAAAQTTTNIHDERDEGENENGADKYVASAAMTHLSERKTNSDAECAVHTIGEEEEEEMEVVVSVDKGKYFGVADASRGVEQWKANEPNPDYRLVEVHAANPGFQAKYNDNYGSYLLYEFTQRMKRNIALIQENKDETLGMIFDKIQNVLHNKGKQQTTNLFNNNTRDIKLRVHV